MFPYLKYAVRPAKEVLLGVRYYPAEARPAAVKPPIVLVHGLMNTADVFDLPDSPRSSFAQRLRMVGHDVYTYDQRGAGDSRTKDWTFGMRENSFIDLPQVIASALERSHSDTVILGGYGLGGLYIFLLMSYLIKYETSLRNITLNQIEKVFAIASPGIFLPRKGRWQYFCQRGWKFFAKMRAPLIDRADFFKAQVYAYDPALSRLLPKMLIQAMGSLAQRYRPMASLLKALPLATLYHPIDLDTAIFSYWLRSQALHRTSKQLFLEILHYAQSSRIKVAVPEGTIELPHDFRLWQDVPLLLFSSHKDQFVLPTEMMTVADNVRGARLCLIDDVFTNGCGHLGYLLQSDLCDYITNEIIRFIHHRPAPASASLIRSI